MEKVKCWIGGGGAVMVSIHIEGITQKLSDQDTVNFYGGENFLCETCLIGAAKSIAMAKGWEFLDK